MTYKENIKAILECYFTGFKDEIIESACNRILEQEPILDNIITEIENDWQLKKYPGSPFSCGLREALAIINKYKPESEDH